MAANDEEENDKQIVSQAASALIKAAYHSPAESRGDLLNLQPRNTDEATHRHKYCCPRCKINVWGKPRLRVKCANCNALLLDMNRKPLPKIQKVVKKSLLPSRAFLKSR